MALALISLGSNLGDRGRQLRQAIEFLGTHEGLRMRAASSLVETKPIGGPAGQGAFLNAAVAVETSLSPAQLHASMRTLEKQMGRTRKIRWDARTLDLDLLLYDDVIVATDQLVVPHPRMTFRRFVLEPAAEIAADMVHPQTGWTIGRHLQHLNHSANYVALAGPIGVGKTEVIRHVADHDGLPGGPPLVVIEDSIDDRQLQAFYQDPAANSWSTDVALLEARAQLVQPGPKFDNLAMSDFWFDQSVAFSRLWQPAAQQREFEGLWRELRSQVVLPKLVVFLDAPTERLLQQIAQRGRRYEAALTVAWIERLRHELKSQFRRSDVGCVLELELDNIQVAVTEIRAALEAMQ